METLSACAAFDDCRWIEIPRAMFGGWLVVWSDCDDYSYSGHAEALLSKVGAFAFVEWVWGSCEYCDAYMGLSDEEVRAEFEKDAMRFSDLAALRTWFDMLRQTNGGNVEAMAAAVDAMLAASPS